MSTHSTGSTSRPRARTSIAVSRNFYLEVAESANLNAGKLAPGGQRLDVAIAEQDNIRGALAWARGTGPVALGLELATAMEQFWALDDPREGMRWFAALLERPDADAARREVLAHALRAYGSSADLAGHDKEAARLYRQSLELFDQLGDEHGRAVLLHRLGIQLLRRGELERAVELVESSNEIHERLNDRWGQAQTIGTLGAIARDDDDDARAYELIAQSAALAREVEVPWWESGVLAELACLAFRSGDLDDAETRAHESLVLADRLEDRAGRVFGVGLMARLAAERRQPERAGLLWGAIEAEDTGAPLGGWRRHRAAFEARTREVAGPEFERGCVQGRELALAEAVAVALVPPADVAGSE